ncbi:hypothetical protein DPMN_066292 [Dreissena polymorpha]|uniref:Uncharacterized protein n=1 Tax=Dreissena polymorpha TaxID=45954 RepID=A0A9D3YX23_DREPO|nr:hypothetical protein DPMN_066292 [Dreissena polymorpha]
MPPRLKPVNSPAESRSTRTGYGLSRAPRPGIAPVVAGCAPSPGIPEHRRHSPGLYRHQTPAELRQRPGFNPVMNRRSPGECRWRPGRAPVYLCTVAIPGLYRGSTGSSRIKHRGSAGIINGVQIVHQTKKMMKVMPGENNDGCENNDLAPNEDEDLRQVENVLSQHFGKTPVTKPFASQEFDNLSADEEDDENEENNDGCENNDLAPNEDEDLRQVEKFCIDGCGCRHDFAHKLNERRDSEWKNIKYLENYAEREGIPMTAAPRRMENIPLTYLPASTTKLDLFKNYT